MSERDTSNFRKSMLLKERTGARKGSGPPRAPALWAHTECTNLPPAVWGQYPRGFLAWACRHIGARNAAEVLHVCSGALPPGTGVRVDLRASQRPDVCADGQALPFADDCFDAVLLDPPYSREHAAELYGTPRFSLRAMISEALRVVAPGRPVGVLAFHVPFYDRTLGTLESIHGITTGSGYQIRAFSVVRKLQRALPFAGGTT